MLLMERWLSGPKRRFAKPLSRKTREGSNPSLSAFARRGSAKRNEGGIRLGYDKIKICFIDWFKNILLLCYNSFSNMPNKRETLKELLKPAAIATILAPAFLGMVELGIRIIDTLSNPNMLTSFYLNNEPKSALITTILAWGIAHHVLREAYRRDRN